MELSTREFDIKEDEKSNRRERSLEKSLSADFVDRLLSRMRRIADSTL